MKYKGYTGTIEPDEESGVLFGRVIGLRDVITFEGDTVPELIKAFQDSVDSYLAFCAKREESPEKPYSGQFVLRIDPQLHRELANLAQAQSVSLNALIESVLKKKVLPDAQSRPSSPLRAARRLQGNTTTALERRMTKVEKQLKAQAAEADRSQERRAAHGNLK